MENHTSVAALLQGFSKLTKDERFAKLLKLGFLSKEDVKLLTSSKALTTDLAENLVENVLGYFQMPLGVATNFRIDERDYVIPMAVEETSIIAAASKTAKWIRDTGQLTTAIKGACNIGQIQIARVKNLSLLTKILAEKKDYLINKANEEAASGLYARGGGVRDLQLRTLPREDSNTMAVIHVFVDTCDAMGANIINQICEYLKILIEELTQEKVTMCILSNLNDEKIITATVHLNEIDAELGEKIVEASIFAELDPYRAATSNKGVLNGMDAVCLATGNDWRAVEAGVHAYAARAGQYQSITKWRLEGKNLIGTLESPITIGIIGGVTKLHPVAQMCLKMLKIITSNDLARIIAAVGLVQNLGAIRALTTVGIIEGHMKLHINNLTLGAGAKAKEVPLLRRRLEEILRATKRVTMSNALETLQQIRAELSST